MVEASSFARLYDGYSLVIRTRPTVTRRAISLQVETAFFVVLLLAHHIVCFDWFGDGVATVGGVTLLAGRSDDDNGALDDDCGYVAPADDEFDDREERLWAGCGGDDDGLVERLLMRLGVRLSGAEVPASRPLVCAPSPSCARSFAATALRAAAAAARDRPAVASGSCRCTAKMPQT